MDLLGSLSQDAQPEYAKCSRKGCQQAAEFQLLWNNPKVHTPERRKIWLACSEHVGWLRITCASANSGSRLFRLRGSAD